MEAFKNRGIDISHLEIIPGGETPKVPRYLVENDRKHGDPVRGIMEAVSYTHLIGHSRYFGGSHALDPAGPCGDPFWGAH